MNRTITEHDREVAARLKHFYNAKKKELGLNQTILSELLGVNQSSISQMMNATMAMNLNHKAMMADVLEVDISQIDPKIKSSMLRVLPTPTTVKVKFALEGVPVNNNLKVTTLRLSTEQERICYAIELNTVSGIAVAGSHAIADPSVEPIEGDTVFLARGNGEKIIGLLSNPGGNKIRVSAGENEVTLDLNKEEPLAFDLILGFEMNQAKHADRAKR
ncbi:XRE family transcriptional regulator [Motiliproteus coralliicola]|uniref:XRE family transcriptional regulator n=1 Tax=Motiliproteus coralliicola TaxID=2283196 RepID=A0A369WSV5_9GAMM|nr:helix-turn-helix transcriptional regulator [Motiliproteus coralliicola]RDE25180.1 XRE family transcriptional regulator [Motiliproteus coralliicola]